MVCLVVFGNHKVEGVEYTKTFSPIEKMVTIDVGVL